MKLNLKKPSEQSIKSIKLDETNFMKIMRKTFQTLRERCEFIREQISTLMKQLAGGHLTTLGNHIS